MNQKTKYVRFLAILPLLMVAASPDLIGDADARNGGMREAISLEPYVEKVSVTPFSGESPDSYKASFMVHAGGWPLNDVTVVVSSDRDSETTTIAGVPALGSSITTVIIKASDPSSTTAQIENWNLDD